MIMMVAAVLDARPPAVPLWLAQDYGPIINREWNIPLRLLGHTY